MDGKSAYEGTLRAYHLQVRGHEPGRQRQVSTNRSKKLVSMNQSSFAGLQAHQSSSMPSRLVILDLKSKCM